MFVLFGCNNDSKTGSPTKSVNYLSHSQSRIQALVDSFRTEYNIGVGISKDSIINKYNEKFFDYLSEDIVDSVEVHVDTVIINGLAVTTELHSNNDIAFQYTLNFKRDMPSRWDSIFQFMKGLKPGSDILVNFQYMGSHLLGNPNDTSRTTIKIYAFPLPISFKPKAVWNK